MCVSIASSSTNAKSHRPAFCLPRRTDGSFSDDPWRIVQMAPEKENSTRLNLGLVSQNLSVSNPMAYKTSRRLNSPYSQPSDTSDTSAIPYRRILFRCSSRAGLLRECSKSRWSEMLACRGIRCSRHLTAAGSISKSTQKWGMAVLSMPLVRAQGNDPVSHLLTKIS